MDYAANQALASTGLQAGSARDTKPLESLSLAVQRINTAQVRISRFLDRWHGQGPAEPPSAGGENGQTVTTPHAMNLERLFQAIDRLETRCDALESIG